MSVPKEYKALLAPYLAAGFTLQPRRRSAHVAVLDPSGRLIAMIPHTPSDRRSLQNTRADLRRAARNIVPTQCV